MFGFSRAAGEISSTVCVCSSAAAGGKKKEEFEKQKGTGIKYHNSLNPPKLSFLASGQLRRWSLSSQDVIGRSLFVVFFI